MLSLGNKLSLTTQPIYKFVNEHSVDFDGVDDCIVTDGADTVAQPTTYSFWCKTSETGRNSVFGHGQDNYGSFSLNETNMPLLWLNNTKYRYWTNIPQQDDGEWHHWVLYADTNTITNSKLYCDGVLQTAGSTSDTTTTSPYTTSLIIGGTREAGSNFFNGKIDEFAVYDRELTQAEITRMYNTYYSPNRVANGNFAQIGNEEVTNGDFSQIGNEEVTNGDFSQIGSEQVTNGDFATDSDWNMAGGTFEITNGKLHCISDGSYQYAGQGGVFVVGKTYKVTFDIVDYTSGSIRVRPSGQSPFNTYNANGTYTQYITATNTTLVIERNSACDLFVDNVSVKEVGQSWTFQDGWTMNDNGAAITNGSSAVLRQNNILALNTSYKVVFEIKDYVQGSVNIKLAPTVFVGNVTGNGVYTIYTTPTNSANDDLQVIADSNFTGTIDNISVKEVGQDWTVVGSDSTHYVEFLSTGARYVSDTTSPVLELKQTALTSGKQYVLTCNVAYAVGSGALRFWVGANQTTFTEGANTKYFTATSTTLSFLRDAANVDCVISNVTVKEVGQHWTFGTGWSTDGTKALFTTDGSASSAKLEQVTSFNNGSTYKVLFDLIDTNSAGVYVRLAGGSWSSSIAGTGSKELSLVAGSGNDIDIEINDGTKSLSIDNIVVQELKHDATNLMLNAGAYQSANPLITSTKSMEFDGTDDFLKVEDSANLRGMAALTVCCWVKVDSKSNYAKVLDYSNTSGNSQRKYRIQLSSDTDQKLQFLIANTSDSTSIITTTDAFPTNKWVHIVGTFDNSLSSNRQSLYIDGVLENTATAFTETINNDDSGFLSFGENTYGANNFDGKTTEAGIYNRCLTALEVASLYNQGMPTNLLVNRNNYQSGNPTVFNTKQVDFDGTDDYLKVTNAYGSFTGSISAWVKRDSNSSFQFITDFRDNSGTGFFYFDENSDTLVASSGTIYVDGVAATTLSTDGNWHQAVVTGITLDITQSIFIGQRHTGIFLLNGKLSQVGLWNSTLTADEVSSLYNHGLPIDLTTNQAAYASSSNLVGYWRMGSGTLDSYPLIADQTNATLGSELVTNGDFATDSDWIKETGWTISGGTANRTNTGTYTALQQNILTSGKTYKVTFTISSITSGEIYGIRLGSNYILRDKSTTGTYTGYGTANGSTLSIMGNPSFAGSVDNVSIKQVQGNPAIMTNQTSSDIENGSPYANVIQNGDFSDGTSGWNFNNATLNSGGARINNIGLGTANAYIIQNDILVVGKTYKMQFDIVATNGKDLVLEKASNTSLDATTTGSKTIYFTQASTDDIVIKRIVAETDVTIDNITVEELNTGLQGYWKMGDGTNDEYPVIYDQVDPTLGSELVTNGDFTTDISGWSGDASRGSYAWDNGRAKITNDAASGYPNLYQNPTTVAGKVYKVTATVDIGTATLTEVRVYDGGILGNQQRTTSGTFEFYFTAVGTIPSIHLYLFEAGNTGHYCYFDNVSIKQVQGNPATMTNMVEGNITNQYPLTKIRNYYRMGDGIMDGYPIIQDQTSPNLAHIPTTNLFIYSEDFSQSNWQKDSGATLTSGQTSPIGDNTAFKLQFSGTNQYIQYPISGLDTTKDYTISFYAKVDSGTTTIDAGNMIAGSYEVLTVTDEWQRFEVTQTPSATTRYPRPIQSNGSDTVYLWGCQFEVQSQATAYIKSDGIAAVRKSSTTNLVPYSEDFSEWNLIRATLGAKITSPFGTDNANSLIASTANDDHFVTKNISVVNTNVYSFSAYLKKGSKSFARLWNTSIGYADFDLENGIVGTQSSVTGNIEFINNGWYRCSIVYTATSTSSDAHRIYTLDGDNDKTFAGDGSTINLYLWGAQLEEQTQAETYAKTTGLPVTIDLFTENNYGTMTNQSSSDIVEDTP